MTSGKTFRLARRQPVTFHLLCAATVLTTAMAVSCKSKEETPQEAPTLSPTSTAPHTETQAPPPSPADARPAAAGVHDGWNFDSAEPGRMPDGWSAPVGQWRIEVVQGAPSEPHVLAQTAQNSSPVFNVALIQGERHADVDISVRLRARDGRIDQGGGIVWRASDASNYYIARYNPLEDNYRVYHVKEGRRRQLASADVSASQDAWHTLRVTMTGDHIECFLDGQKHLDTRDTTFTGAGLIGLWTKADARTEFDDLEVGTPAAGLDAKETSSAASDQAR